MMRELRAVYALPLHANVVDYVRFWQEGRKLHIQMELCEGGSLDTLLKRSEICQDEKVPEDMLWLILRCHNSALVFCSAIYDSCGICGQQFHLC